MNSITENQKTIDNEKLEQLKNALVEKTQKQIVETITSFQSEGDENLKNQINEAIISGRPLEIKESKEANEEKLQEANIENSPVILPKEDLVEKLRAEALDLQARFLQIQEVLRKLSENAEQAK